MQENLSFQQKRSSEFLEQRHKLMAYLISLTGDSHVAEDIFQEVWMRLAAHTENDIQNTHAWCRAVAKNLVLHHWRNKGNQKVAADSEIIEKMDQAFEENEQDQGRDKKDALQKCIKELPQHSKQLLDSKYIDGSSFQDLSNKLGKTESSLMMSLSRIRKKLQDCIQLRLKNEGATL